jgi:uncharacterized protein
MPVDPTQRRSIETRDGIPAWTRSVAAALAGAGVGILGGLLGLGGAEFRLPLLVTLFRSTLRRAVSLNLAISFVAVVVVALVARWALAKQVPMASVAAVAICMMLGGMAGATLGARWLARISDERLHAAGPGTPGFHRSAPDR